MIAFTPLSPRFGVQTCDGDLSQPLYSAAFEALEQEQYAYQVLVMRAQHISAAQLLAFCAAFSTRLGEQGSDWLLVDGTSPAGSFRLYSKKQRFKLEPGWTVLYLAPEPERKPEVSASPRCPEGSRHWAAAEGLPAVDAGGERRPC